MEIRLMSQRIDFQYSIGEYIQHNIQEIKKFASEIATLMELEIESQDRINLIGRGSSGAIIGTLSIEYLLEKFPGKIFHMVHIKKEGEFSHNSIYEDIFENALNIFVDDFISTGTTIQKTIEYIRLLMINNKWQFDAIVLGRYTSEYESKRLEDYTKLFIGYKF